MQFDSWSDSGCSAQGLPLDGSAEPKLGLGIIINTPVSPLHEQAKEGIDEIQNTFTASEIFDERNGRAGAFAPRFDVVLENIGIREAEPVDALFDVTNQKAIRFGALATEGNDDFILSGIDILILIDENETQLSAPVMGRAGRLLGIIIPQETKRVLLEVVEINHAQFPLVLGEGLFKFLRQFQQRGHLPADPIPILREGIIFFV